MIHIRRMTEKDIPKVIKLVEDSFGDEGEFYLDYYPVDMRVAVVLAEDQQAIVGVATTYFNYGHPHWLKMMVAVDKNFRRQGIGKRLHEAAFKARDLELPIQGLQGYCYKGEDEAENFMKTLGYSLRLTCYILELDFTQRKPSPRLARKFGHLEIVPFTKLLGSSAGSQQIFDFLLTRYIEEHFWSPPMPKEHPDWEEIVF